MRIMALVVALGCACGSEPAALELSVDLRTDFVPSVEFSGVRVELVDEGIQRESLAGNESYVEGRRVADIAELPPSERRTVAVTLVGGDGSAVARREVAVAQSDDLAVTVVISRDCLNVTCDAVGGLVDRCLGGRCVDPECVEGDEEACLEPACTVDADCLPMASCATPTCRSGVCLYDPDDSCAAGEYCDAERGCSPLSPTTCSPTTDATFVLHAGTPDGEGVSARPTAVDMEHDGERAWVLVRTSERLRSGLQSHDAVLIRVDCEGDATPPELVLEEITGPDLVLADGRAVVMGRADPGPGFWVVDLDPSTGAPATPVLVDGVFGAALPRADGYDLLEQQRGTDDIRRYGWRPVDGAGAPTGPLVFLRPADPYHQGLVDVVPAPTLAVGYTRSEPGGINSGVEGISVWTEALGPVPLLDGPISRAHPPRLVWRGDTLWAALPPAGFAAIERIDESHLRLFSVDGGGAATEHSLPPSPAGAGDFMMDMTELGPSAVAIGWLRRFEDDSPPETYVRRVDLEGGVRAAPEVRIPTEELPVDWEEGDLQLLYMGEDLIFVTWIEEQGSGSPSTAFGRFVRL